MSSNEVRVKIAKECEYRQRQNLLCVCRLAVKSLIDKSCFETIDDTCPEFINFTVILEHILSYRLKGHTSWFIVEEPRCFWEYIRRGCRKVPHSCIKSIQAMENIKSTKTKGRAWLRVALMEKRLSEYISTALKEDRLTRHYYDSGAIMLSEDVHILTGLLLGLNAIDFSFCLKGEDLESRMPGVIDYTPYLRFQQCPESILSDEVEIKSLSSPSDSNGTDLDDTEDDSVENKFCRLQDKYRILQQQKGYLEELVRLRESQLLESQRQQERLIRQIEDIDLQARLERQEFETVILELQEQLFSLKEQPRRELESHLTSQWRSAISRTKQTDIAMEDITANIHVMKTEKLCIHTDRESLQSLDQSGSDIALPSPTSLTSSTERQMELRNDGIREMRRDKEDTPSLVPLTGSLTSQISLKSVEMNLGSSTSSGRLSDNPQSASQAVTKATDTDTSASDTN